MRDILSEEIDPNASVASDPIVSSLPGVLVPEETLRQIREAMERLLGDLSDAERAVRGWSFKGGMGANIASEDRGRFPSIASKSHREAAEAALSELRRLEGK